MVSIYFILGLGFVASVVGTKADYNNRLLCVEIQKEIFCS